MPNQINMRGALGLQIKNHKQNEFQFHSLLVLKDLTNSLNLQKFFEGEYSDMANLLSKIILYGYNFHNYL